MTTNADVFQAVIDAVVKDPKTTQAAAANVVRSVASVRVSREGAEAWLEELAALYRSIGVIPVASWPALREELSNAGPPIARALFDALAGAVNGLESTGPINLSVRILELRAERDEVDANLDTLQALKESQPRQVRDAIQLGREQLRGYKQNLITELQSIGDNEADPTQEDTP